jgi:hypothetical protein
MSLHIAKFIDRLRSAEDRGHRDVIIPVSEARMLHADITRLLLLLENSAHQTPPSTSVQVELKGRPFNS